MLWNRSATILRSGASPVSNRVGDVFPQPLAVLRDCSDPRGNGNGRPLVIQAAKGRNGDAISPRPGRRAAAPEPRAPGLDDSRRRPLLPTCRAEPSRASSCSARRLVEPHGRNCVVVCCAQAKRPTGRDSDTTRTPRPVSAPPVGDNRGAYGHPGFVESPAAVRVGPRARAGPGASVATSSTSKSTQAPCPRFVSAPDSTGFVPLMLCASRSARGWRWPESCTLPDVPVLVYVGACGRISCPRGRTYFFCA